VARTQHQSRNAAFIAAQSGTELDLSPGMIEIDFGVDPLLVKRSLGVHGNDQWDIAQECDTHWMTRARQWGGGFFHHPGALELSAPGGTPVVATCTDSVGVAALAVGVRWRCRLSGRPRHAYFPSLPVARPGVDHGAVVRSLCEVLRRTGVDDVTFDSFDAPDESRNARWGVPGAERAEYRVALDAMPAELNARLSSHHTRIVNRGDRDDWTLDISTSDAAVADLARVAQSATDRAASRGNPFAADPWHIDKARQLSNNDWGVAVHRATKEGRLLSAALIGWGGDRAFYLGGGSTAEGYECGAATWMHWRTMLHLRERGLLCYNLGGAPGGASSPAHPAHGLHRFKSAFGAHRVSLHGLQWTDNSLHAGLHRAARRLASTQASATDADHPTPVHAS
jgi:hypothetical protein